MPVFFNIMDFLNIFANFFGLKKNSHSDDRDGPISASDIDVISVFLPGRYSDQDQDFKPWVQHTCGKPTFHSTLLILPKNNHFQLFFPLLAKTNQFWIILLDFDYNNQF